MTCGWGVAVKRVAGGFEIVKGDFLPPDDPDYGSDLHIVPIMERDGEDIIGLHTPERDCFCRPRIQERAPARSFVIHQESVN